MISGYYYKKLKTHPLPFEVCPGCGASGLMHIESGCRVHHLMFVPSWANKKCVFVTCQVCNASYPLHEYPHLQEAAVSLFSLTRYRWYHYTGTFFVICFFAFVAGLIFTGETERNDQIQQEIENLTVNDVIYYKVDSKNKTSMMVTRMRNDTVWVRENRLATNKNVSSIDYEYNYTEKESIYTKSQLEEMHKQSKIIKISN